MKIKKIYISAPIAGYDIQERRNFFASVEKEINSIGGRKAVNPMNNGLAHDAALCEHMKRDILLLLDCDEIYFYGAWEDSAGCQCEWNVARNCGIKRTYID